VAPIEEKLIQHRLIWFGHVQRRPPEAAPVRSGVLKQVDNVKRGRGRPKLTWGESVKRDLKEWNISKQLAMDRSAWRLAINVPNLCPYFCLPLSVPSVSCLFVFLLSLFIFSFISSLPQLAWDKRLCCCCIKINDFSIEQS
jgi:hypothetical protein